MGAGRRDATNLTPGMRVRAACQGFKRRLTGTLEGILTRDGQVLYDVRTDLYGHRIATAVEPLHHAQRRRRRKFSAQP